MPTKPKPIAKATEPVAPAEDNAFDAFMRILAEYEAKIDSDSEVGIATVVHQGGFHLTDVDYDACGLITLSGVDRHDRPVMLIQDDTQLNLELVALPKRRASALRLGRP